jgi:hypothetical protein
MSDVLGKRFRFSWTDKDKGAQCHQARCKEFAVSHRLCAAHGAFWLSRGQQPPMPDYERDPAPNVIQALENDARDAERERKAMSALPMRNANDARTMRDQLVGARHLIEQTRAARYRAIRPLLETALKLRRAHNETIAAYRSCEDLALTRLQQFEHLHDFEVAKPSKSGIPPRPQAAQRRSVKPPAKKKGGRRRA